MQVGDSRAVIRKKESTRLAAKRAVEAAERDEAVETRVKIQQRNVTMQEAIAKESILSSKKKRETATVKNVEAKLSVLEKNKDIFVRQNGEEAYEAKVNELISKMLKAGEESDDDDEPITNEVEEQT